MESASVAGAPRRGTRRMCAATGIGASVRPAQAVHIDVLIARLRVQRVLGWSEAGKQLLIESVEPADWVARDGCHDVHTSRCEVLGGEVTAKPGSDSDVRRVRITELREKGELRADWLVRVGGIPVAEVCQNGILRICGEPSTQPTDRLRSICSCRYRLPDDVVPQKRLGATP